MARYNSFQDAFGKVWQYFVVEKHPRAFDASLGTCAYWIPATGCKCAIGCLLTDEEAAELDRGTLRKATCFMRERDIIPNSDENAWYGFLNLLQVAHDAYDGDGDFHKFIETRLRDVANEYKLAVPEEASR